MRLSGRSTEFRSFPEAEGGATVVASHDLLVCIGVPLIGAHIRKAVAHHYIAITYSQAAMNSAADSDTMPEANSIADSNIRTNSHKELRNGVADITTAKMTN